MSLFLVLKVFVEEAALKYPNDEENQRGPKSNKQVHHEDIALLRHDQLGKGGKVGEK